MMLFQQSPYAELEWEIGRRLRFASFKKDDKYYEEHGVRVKESFRKNSRGIEIFQKEWLPIEGDGKALIFMCHGYGDTCTYFYDDTAMRLVKEGYAVFAMDYEGHGLSEGLHAYVRSFETLVDDCIEYFSSIKERAEFRKKKCFLFGESMGGAVSLVAHFKRPHAWDGAVLLSPMCKIAEEITPPKVVVEILKRLAVVFPTWKAVPAKNLCDVAFRVPEKRLKGKNNPIAFKGFPRLRTALELLNITFHIGKHMQEITMPFLVLHGSADVVTVPQCSQELFDSAGSKDKMIKIYEDSWHCLISGEPDDVVERVMSDILDWLNSHSQDVPIIAANTEVDADCDVDGSPAPPSLGSKLRTSDLSSPSRAPSSGYGGDDALSAINEREKAATLMAVASA